jgi:hypothetical protein
LQCAADLEDFVGAGQNFRRELIVRLALNTISDDYENLAQVIEPTVAKDGADCGITIEKSEIVAALEELVTRGWAKAWRLNADRSPPVEFDRMPTIEEMEDFSDAWFYITDAGMKVQLEPWEFWPWDDDNQLRKDWTPPLN